MRPNSDLGSGGAYRVISGASKPIPTRACTQPRRVLRSRAHPHEEAPAPAGTATWGGHRGEECDVEQEGGRASETAPLPLRISLCSIRVTRPGGGDGGRPGWESNRLSSGARSVSRSVESSVKLHETPGPPAPQRTQAIGRSGGHDYPPPTCSSEGVGSGSRVHFASSCCVGHRRARIRCLDRVGSWVLS